MAARCAHRELQTALVDAGAFASTDLDDLEKLEGAARLTAERAALLIGRALVTTRDSVASFADFEARVLTPASFLVF